MKFHSLRIYQTRKYSTETKEWQEYYDTTITFENKDEHKIELKLTSAQTNQIVKVVAPMLEQAFSDISKEIKEQLTADESE